MPFVTFADRYERQKGKVEGLLSGLERGLDALVARAEIAADLDDVREALSGNRGTPRARPARP